MRRYTLCYVGELDCILYTVDSMGLLSKHTAQMQKAQMTEVTAVQQVIAYLSYSEEMCF